MKTTLYSIEGKALKQIDLPEVFEGHYRDDLIKRAVLSDESKEYQPKGSYKFAGLETSAKYRGRKEMYGAIKNKGIPHLPHEVQPKGQFGKVKRVPHAVKGRRAHPPKPETKIIEEVNKKEYRKALMSALAATAQKDVVNARYKKLSLASYPLVMDNSFESLKKTQDVLKVFELLNLNSMVINSKSNGCKGALVVATGNVLKAAKNIAGVETVSPSKLKVKHLAPGCAGGRVTIYSENALNELKKMFA
ncbi:MAG: uL4 family ribosomal protein [Candidatus Micrarchaeota archaeon]|nr:uL4 family ribosomal protein [Candidatus Micrarchaeota archaeon]